MCVLRSDFIPDRLQYWWIWIILQPKGYNMNTTSLSEYVKLMRKRAWLDTSRSFRKIRRRPTFWKGELEQGKETLRLDKVNQVNEYAVNGGARSLNKVLSMLVVSRFWSNVVPECLFGSTEIVIAQVLLSNISIGVVASAKTGISFISSWRSGLLAPLTLLSCFASSHLMHFLGLTIMDRCPCNDVSAWFLLKVHVAVKHDHSKAA